MIMRNLIFALITILFWGQQTTVNGQQTSCTVPEPVEGTMSGQQISCAVPEPVEGTTSGASTSSATEGKTQRLNDSKTQSEDSASLRLCDSASFHEYQIRKADSLYKNYLPQYNFDEVKAAMEFFDSLQLSKTTDNRQRTTDFVHWWTTDNGQQTTDIFHRSRTKSCTSDAYPRTVDCCPLSVDFSCAKAHYYHAVGLTERDDIVGACEHYLIALEIMEEMMANDKSLKAKGKKSVDCCPLSVDNNEDYEKIRFVSLIYTRLGQMFYNESYCDIAISNYQKALHYTNILENVLSIAQTLKNIGNSYLLQNNADSALYYYNKSLKTSSDIYNKLDIEKCIAQILYFHKYEFDSAFMILKNNLNKIDNENVKYSYHYTLGNMYYNNKSYDSALYYLEESLDNNIITKKLAFTTTLSAIYDSIGDYEKKAYYDNLSSKLFFNNINKEVEKSKLQNLYNNYNERKTDKIKKEAKVRTVIVGGFGLISVVLLFVYMKYKHKKHSNSLRKEIDNYVKEVENKNCVISEKEQLVKDYHEINVRKDAIIRKQKKELYDIKHKSDKLDKKTKLDRFYKSDICENILKREGMDLMPLTENELQLLITTANYNLDNLIARLFDEFPKLTTIDMYCICLVVLLNNNTKIAYMLDRNRKTIWERINRIKNIIGLDIKEDLFLHIIENYI